MWAYRDIGRGWSFQRVLIVCSKLVHWCVWSWYWLGWRLGFTPVTAGRMVNPIQQPLGVIVNMATAFPQTLTRDCLQTQYWNAQRFLLPFSARWNEPSRFTQGVDIESSPHGRDIGELGTMRNLMANLSPSPSGDLRLSTGHMSHESSFFLWVLSCLPFTLRVQEPFMFRRPESGQGTRGEKKEAEFWLVD